MRIEWMIIAEALAHDARGALTLVGLGQNLLVVESLPAGTRRAVVSHIADPIIDRELRIRVALLSPKGRTLSAQEASLQVGPAPFEGVPSAGLDVPIEFTVGVTEYGTHRFVCEVTDEEEKLTVSGEVEFFVTSTERLQAREQWTPAT